jgi:glycosyltransferase involved in cell wall biosynthesis
MKKSDASPLLVFAHIPPPEHGQSLMVAEMLGALEDAGSPEFLHVDARVSDGFGDVGGISGGKVIRLAGYLRQAYAARFFRGSRVLYYVPGPVKWSAVVRDWMVLAALRPVYGKSVFHWHAIGQGEWAHGSDRCRLPGPGWVDRIARVVSRLILRKPALSVAVSSASGRDGRAIGSRRAEVVCNGMADPCPDYGREIAPVRKLRSREFAAGGRKEVRVLFLSRGTEEKGLFDVLDATQIMLGNLPDGSGMKLVLTFAGGVESSAEERFDARIASLSEEFGGERIEVRRFGYVSGDEKARCFGEADLFFAPSRWESFGLNVAEAMAWGLPVVAAGSDGVRGVLRSDYDWLAEPGDSAELGAILGDACEAVCRGEGEARGDGLRREFLERFAVGRFRREISDVLAEVCDV